MRAADYQPPFDSVPPDIVAALPGLDSLSSDLGRKLRQCDSEYAEDAAAVVIRTLAWLRRSRVPGVPVFLTGGGSGSALVRRIVERVDQWARGYWDTYRGLIHQRLPMDIAVGPDDRDGGGHRSRMAVAYGLNFPEIDIGTIVPPHDIPDVEPEPMRRRDWQQAYVDKDAV